MKQCLRLTEKNIKELLVMTDYIRTTESVPHYIKHCALNLEQRLTQHSNKHLPKVFEQISERPVSLYDIL